MCRMICPKCHYEATEHDADRMPGVCPSCGIAYAKWQAKGSAQEKLATDKLAPKETFAKRLYYYLLFMPSDRHESAFWGHLLIYVWFFIWGWYFISGGIDWIRLGDSFLHYVNLPFHEYGHIFFRPFGEIWTLMGGSIFQILVPLAPLLYFLVWQRDNFAASLMLWWSGQNCLDVSPYVADAPTRLIPLIAGIDEAHDWWNVLTLSDRMSYANLYASLFFGLGVVLIIVSQLWGATLLTIEMRGQIKSPGI